MKTVIYARVSTADQTNAIQIRELTEYVERRRSKLAGIYPDQISGARASRAALDNLMADARLGKFDAVVVWKLDRFGRALVHCAGPIQELPALGIRFMAASQGLDADESNPAFKLLMHSLLPRRKLEREPIHELVRCASVSAQ